MKDIKACQSCLEFMSENNLLKKEIRKLKKELKEKDRTPFCKLCCLKLEKVMQEARSLSDFKIAINEEWICKGCQKRLRAKSIERDSTWN